MVFGGAGKMGDEMVRMKRRRRRRKRRRRECWRMSMTGTGGS
jgi:hypothetical protein